MPTIFLFVNATYPNGDVIGCAIAEDGHCLGGHLSSNVSYAKHDMGLTSTWKHDRYAAHYPEGYEVEWVDDPPNHPGLQDAFAKNQELGQQAREGVPA